MKKSRMDDPFVRKDYKLIQRKMKLTFLLAFLAFVTSWGNGFSQKTTLNLKLKNVPAQNVIQQVEKLTDYYFLYQDNLFKKGQLVSVGANGETLESVLDELATQTGTQYEISDRQIILKKQDPTQLPRAATQQAKTITGIVTDPDGEPVVGAYVYIKGTTNGIITDANGKYSLRLPAENSTLICSFVGMKTQEIQPGSKSTVNFVLEGDQVALDEVVAIGYGTVKKSDLTGSVSSVKSEDIVKSGTLALDQALAGKASGVMVTQGSGVPGSGASIKIRGINSMRGSSPLYIIDGVAMDNTSLSTMNSEQEASSQISPLSLINTSDIASIEILKDASATAIYGSRGSNGVIIITTKSGKAGKAKIEVDAEYGMTTLPHQIKLLDGNQYWLTRYEAAFNNKVVDDALLQKADSARSGLFKTTNWQDIIYRQGRTQNYNISLSGGTEDINYLISSNVFDARGIIEKTDFTRVSTRVNLDAKLSPNAKIGTRLYYASINSNQVNTTTNFYSNNGTNSIIMRALMTSPTAGEYAEDDEDGVEFYTPTSALEANDYENFISQFIGNMFVDLTVFNGLHFRSDFSYQIRNANQRFYQKNILPAQYSRGGWAKTNDSRVRMYSTTNTLNYSKQLAEHKIDAVLGQSTEWFDHTAVTTSNYGFANDILGYYAPQTALFMDPDLLLFTDSRLVSFFLRANYVFRDKYLLTFTGRADGSSKFAANNKFAFFPAVAVGYRLSEESFLKESETVSNLKLRASYGLSGNQTIDPYQSLDQYAADKFGFGTGSGSEALTPIYYASQLPNSDLRWEQTAQLSLGFDLGLMDNRLTLTADYYKKNTKNLLAVGNKIPAHSGFTTYTENLGSMESNGVDLAVTAQIIEKNFNWNLSATFSTGKTKIKSMGSDYVESGYSQGWVPGGTQRLIIGEEIGAFYGYKRIGISQFDDFTEFTGLSNQERINLYNADPMKVFTPSTADGRKAVISNRPGEQLYEDVDNNGLINELDRQVIGYAQPDFAFGLSNTVSYKNIELSFNIDGQIGQDVCNVTNFDLLAFDNTQQLQKVRERWSPDAPSTVYPRLSTLNNGAAAFKMSDRFIEDGSFVRLQNVTLKYSLPKALLNTINVNSAAVFVSGTNLLTLTDYTGYNPDVSLNGSSTQQMGHDNAGYPVARTVRFGINFKF